MLGGRDVIAAEVEEVEARGDDEHYGVVRYGTDPKDLSQTVRGHIRLNRNHPEKMFRMRMQRLQPQTTYYYQVSSMGSDGSERRGGEPGRHVHHTRGRRTSQ